MRKKRYNYLILKDFFTNIILVKHHFAAGVRAQEGIEF